MADRQLQGCVLSLILLATVVLAATSYAQGSAPPPSSSIEGQQIGKILSVRKILRNQYFGSRYPQMHYYPQEHHVENTEGSEAQGSLSGTKAVLTLGGPLVGLVFQDEASPQRQTGLDGAMWGGLRRYRFCRPLFLAS